MDLTKEMLAQAGLKTCELAFLLDVTPNTVTQWTAPPNAKWKKIAPPSAIKLVTAWPRLPQEEREQLLLQIQPKMQAYRERKRSDHKAWRDKNPEKAREISRKTAATHYARHGDEVRKKQRARDRARRAANPDAEQ